MNKGKYIVLEGPEGVGKTTQIQLLAERLQTAGLPVRLLREPDSQSDLTARTIRQMTQDPRYPMNTRTEVLLYNAARAQSLAVIRDSVAQGVICLVDRNYLTTLAIQYYGRGDVPDYKTIETIIDFAVAGVEPDLCIVLDAPVPVLKQRAASRGAGERFDNLGAEFLERVRSGYLQEADKRNFPVVSAEESLEKIAEAIWQLVSDEFASRQASKAVAVETETAAVIASDSPVSKTTDQSESSGQSTASGNTTPVEQPDEEPALLSKDTEGNYSYTEAGRQYLTETVTDTDGKVYSFTDKLSPVTIAAAMARLSRRGDDMRITILDEFANQLGKDEQLLRRVITAYGDDSVQQLTGLHMVVEDTTKLMTNILERGRLAAYLEQSTRYIYFDKKDKRGNYRYFVPKNLEGEHRHQYCQQMDRIFDLYSEMVHTLTAYIGDHSSVPEAERDAAFRGAIRAQACDAARLVLPTATTTTVGIFASGQAIESMIMYLMSHELPEARDTGEKILKEARKVVPMFLERADKPERGGATVAYRATTHKHVAVLANDYLQTCDGETDKPAVVLTDYWPRNELSLVADMLYEHSSLSLEQIQKQVHTLTYQQKVDIMQSYFGERLNRRHKPGRALEKAHYSWDLVCDFGIFCDLMRHRIVDDLEWQHATPYLGHETPGLIEEAGLTEQYNECFAMSQKLYDSLLEATNPETAQYATLLGHKMRWKVTYNAREAFHLHELRTSPQGHPGYRKLVQQMHEKLSEVHPMIADAMKFVNQGEDEELTRLAAERYTQFKLQQLETNK